MYVANLTFDLGYLEYIEGPGTTSLSYTEIIVIGVVAAAICVIIIIIVIIIVVKLQRKSSQQSRENRRLIQQLTALESSVRDQCKQGPLYFTEIWLFFSAVLFTFYYFYSSRYVPNATKDEYRRPS